MSGPHEGENWQYAAATPSPEVVAAFQTHMAKYPTYGPSSLAEVAQRLINEAVEAERAHSEENYRAFAETCEAYWKLEADLEAAQAATPVAISEALEGVAARIDEFRENGTDGVDEWVVLREAAFLVRQAAKEYKP